MDMKNYLAEMKEVLALCEDKRERLEFLVDYGKELPDFPEESKTTENSISGCVSHVFITAEKKEGKLYFQGSSESLIVKGYVLMLIKALNGLTPQEVIDAEQPLQTFLEETELNVSMLASRANAFGNVYRAMKEKAKTFI